MHRSHREEAWTSTSRDSGPTVSYHGAASSLRAALRPLKMLAAVLAAVAAAQAGATVQAQPWAVQIAPDAPAVERFAARELQSLLSGLCPRLPEPAPRQLRAPQPPTTLLLGYAAVRRALPPSRLPLLSELGDEGFVLGSLSAGGGPAYVLSGGEGAARRERAKAKHGTVRHDARRC